MNDNELIENVQGFTTQPIDLPEAIEPEVRVVQTEDELGLNDKPVVE